MLGILEFWILGVLEASLTLRCHTEFHGKKPCKPDSLEAEAGTGATRPFALFYLSKDLPTIICAIVA